MNTNINIKYFSIYIKKVIIMTQMYKMHTIDIHSENIIEENDDNNVHIINNSSSIFLEDELSDNVPNNIIDRFNDKMIIFNEDIFPSSTDLFSKPKFTEQEDLEQSSNILHGNSIRLKGGEEKQDNIDINMNCDIINNALSVERLDNKIIKDGETIPNIEVNKKKKNSIFQTKKRGRRKTLDGTSEKAHNKYSEDNVIKKIKKIIFDLLIFFVNKVIDLYIDEDKKNNLKRKIRKTITKNRREKKNEGLLKPLDFAIGNNLKKDYFLKLLNMDLKEFLSQNINGKFKLLKKDSNKIIIDEISNDNEIFESIFKIKVEEYIDFFTEKREIDIIQKIESEKKVKFKRANIVLNKINDKRYYSIFYSMLNNFKSWFTKKNGRKRNTSNKE